MTRLQEEGAASSGAFSGEGEVKSAARTVQLLELLAAESTPLTLTEIALRVRIPVSSLHQLLRTLVSRGWLELSARGSEYSIGVRALRTGISFIDRDLVVQAARQSLSSLREQTEETIHLARLDHDRVVYLVSRESSHQLRTVSRIGQTLPAHASALGKAALATKTDDEVRVTVVQPLERLTPHTITSIDGLLAELAEIRAKGYAEEHEENTLNTGCVSVVVPGTTGPYAISCSIPLVRMMPERVVRIAEELRAAAASITLILSHGWRE